MDHGNAASDTLERAFVLAEADRVRHYARATAAPLLDDDRIVLAAMGTNLLLNMGFLQRPLEHNEWPGLVADVRAVLRGHAGCVFSVWPVPASAAEQGVHVDGHPPLMARWPDEPADVPALRDGDELVEVTDDDGLLVAERTLVDGYPLPGDRDSFVPGTAFPAGILGPTRIWSARHGGEPAAVAAGHVAAGINLVEYVATMSGARGRGLGAQVTWAASTGDPSLPAVLISSDLGRPVYERLGYHALSRATFAVIS